MDRYYVYPSGGYWVARKGEDESGVLGSDYADRNEAMEAARNDRGDSREEIFRKDGDSYARVGVLVKHRGPEALWLLREDGSVYGEVDAELGPGGGTPIVVNIAPADERSDAGEVG